MNVETTLVVGCGVSGLSCGIRLLEAGFPVTIAARELPPHTTSNVAAAIWLPYRAYPVERILPWGQATLEALYKLMDTPAAGVFPVQLTEVFEHQTPDPWWRDVVRSFRRAAPSELPAGYVDGYVAEVPMIDTPTYMAYLVERFRRGGGAIVQRSVTTLPELYADHQLIVNCTGVWARDVAGDAAVYPIRGQVVRVRTAAPLRSIADDHGRLAVAYVLPRLADCILGGTAQEHSWSLEADPATADDILRRCAELSAGLGDFEILEHRVGLRPGRPAVRLELERVAAGCAVIHNYGHGGSGFTLSWGCADEVLALVRELKNEKCKM